MMSIPVKIFAFLSLCCIGAFSGWQGSTTDAFSSDTGQGTRYVASATAADTATPDKSAGASFTGITDSLSSSGPTAYSEETWPLISIHMTTAGTVSAKPVAVAILDTGIDANHEELAGKVIVEKCFVDGCDTEDILGHGTFIAGIIAASDENNTGTEGLAPNSRLMNIKVADDKGRCRQSDLIEGIIWAADNGAQVINISIELHEYTSALQEAIDYAWDSGALIIAAAGNDGNSVPVYPAALEHCLSITGIDEAGKRAPLANFGDWVDAAAPGFRIYGIMPEDTYGYQHGTSFATAYASGLAARLFAVATDSNGNGKLNDEVLEAILAGCRELPLEGTGNGLIDVIASEEYLVTPSRLN